MCVCVLLFATASCQVTRCEPGAIDKPWQRNTGGERGRTARYSSACEATGLFLSVLLRRIWVSTWYLQVTQERAGSQNIRTQKRNQTAGGGSDAARLLVEMFDLLIVKISTSHESVSMCQISHRGLGAFWCLVEAPTATPLSFVGHSCRHPPTRAD